MLIWTLFLLLISGLPTVVWGHARLMSPPSRSSMWRLGFRTRKNFNDNALYCGGIHIQWQKNGGKCGVCGDPYDMPHPRDNEAGGKFGRGIISRRYLAGQVMEATVEVTTNHRGYFEFKLCPNNSPRKEASQDCLDKHLLKEARGIGTRYYIGDRGRGDITVKLQLPKGLTCSQCVFQWTYVAGNNWGMCEDGVSRLGCGPQETFRGCADIAIEKSSDVFNYKNVENEIRNKRYRYSSNKVRKQGAYKYSTDYNYADYKLEAPKHSRRNVSRYNALDEKIRPIYHKRPRSKKGDYQTAPPLTSETADYLDEKALSGKSRKRAKYANRNYNERGTGYKTSYSYFPGDRSYEDSSKFLERGAYKTSDSSNRSGRSKKRYSRRRPQRHLELPKFSTFVDHSMDDHQSPYFTVGGRRYKDFWFL